MITIPTQFPMTYQYCYNICRAFSFQFFLNWALRWKCKSEIARLHHWQQLLLSSQFVHHVDMWASKQYPNYWLRKILLEREREREYDKTDNQEEVKWLIFIFFKEEYSDWLRKHLFLTSANINALMAEVQTLYSGLKYQVWRNIMAFAWVGAWCTEYDLL